MSEVDDSNSAAAAGAGEGEWVDYGAGAGDNEAPEGERVKYTPLEWLSWKMEKWAIPPHVLPGDASYKYLKTRYDNYLEWNLKKQANWQWKQDEIAFWVSRGWIVWIENSA